jgi:hypothetical protein
MKDYYNPERTFPHKIISRKKIHQRDGSDFLPPIDPYAFQVIPRKIKSVNLTEIPANELRTYGKWLPQGI